MGRLSRTQCVAGRRCPPQGPSSRAPRIKLSRIPPPARGSMPEPPARCRFDVRLRKPTGCGGAIVQCLQHEVANMRAYPRRVAGPCTQDACFGADCRLSIFQTIGMKEFVSRTQEPFGSIVSCTAEIHSKVPALRCCEHNRASSPNALVPSQHFLP